MPAAMIIPALSLAFTVATTVYSMTNQPKQPKAMKPVQPQYVAPGGGTNTIPTEADPGAVTDAGPGADTTDFTPATDDTGPTPLTREQLLTSRQDNYSIPTFLSSGTNMTPLQQRISIAAGGTNSNDPRYTDRETATAYQQMLLNNYPTSVDDIGAVERQYIKSLGNDPLAETTEGYLTALQNSIGAM